MFQHARSWYRSHFPGDRGLVISQQWGAEGIMQDFPVSLLPAPSAWSLASTSFWAQILG